MPLSTPKTTVIGQKSILTLPTAIEGNYSLKKEEDKVFCLKLHPCACSSLALLLQCIYHTPPDSPLMDTAII